ncbi:MAG: hypothetical protein ABJC79_01280 [Acidimicrobiia bacterium]
MNKVFTRVRALAVTGALVASGVIAVAPGTAHADGPGAGSPWIVSVGDSAISGEAGRWAGNTNNGSSLIDAGGPNAYSDNATHTAEQIPGCHRSTAAMVHIGGGVNSLNIACSGARTYTQTPGSGDFKPGLDFYNSGGYKGQAQVLQEFASTHNVKAIPLLIGANNYGFADIVQQCVTDFLLSPSWWKNYCYDDSSVSSKFTAASVTARTTEVAGAIANIHQAMTNAGYNDTQYKIMVQTYVSPIPLGSGFRYSESGYTRQSTGGCGVWNKDADWANNTAVVKMNQALTNGAAQSGVSNYVIQNDAGAFNGRRLCEKTVGLLEERGVANWTQSNAPDLTEWQNQIRTLSTVFGPYQVQESIHPNYWGQLALRNCLRQAYNGGNIRGGTCTHGTGKNANGEPNMTLG